MSVIHIGEITRSLKDFSFVDQSCKEVFVTHVTLGRKAHSSCYQDNIYSSESASTLQTLRNLKYWDADQLAISKRCLSVKLGIMVSVKVCKVDIRQHQPSGASIVNRMRKNVSPGKRGRHGHCLASC